MGGTEGQVERIEVSAEHAAVSSTHTVKLLRWNNAATILGCIVGICALLTYFFSFSGDWRGVKDDIVQLKIEQSSIREENKNNLRRSEETHDNVERLMVIYGLKPTHDKDVP